MSFRVSRHPGKQWRAATLLAAGGLLLAACSGPGPSSSSSSTPAGANPSTSAAASSAGGGTPSCGTGPITLDAYFETGFPIYKALTDEFSKQFPNVKWNIRYDQFAALTSNAPRVLASDPPDLIRIPQESELAKDHLLLNLDPYAKAFGWDKWPTSQLQSMRVADDGSRGTGPLYAMGLNYSMTGIFYNKELAAKIGMTSPPQTLDELDAVLAKAKAAGITPIVQFNGGATGGFAFPLQNLMADYTPPSEINDWIWQKKGATIDTPGNVKAAQHLQEWIKEGYFDPDANAMDYATMMSRFIAGKALFMFNGDWESGNLDKQMPGKVGFFLMPPLQADGVHAAMSTPLTIGIGAKAKHPDCAAFFLNWVNTNKQARTVDVQVGGSHPMGPADAYMPPIPSGTVTAQTLAAGNVVAHDNGAMDFIANATGSIYAKGWTPNLQELFAGRQTPEGMLKAVQAEYETEVGH
ncbi:MAG: extracellular solute-binding protein [Acidothermus sp.]|nr:extracellular solute-binding protein [Acidothermus sp.]MCL6537308.1 extracellular solute-binding protein [Acidothermus sp.]